MKRRLRRRTNDDRRCPAFCSSYAYFRRVWSPRAAFHLARVRYDSDWRARLVSFFWLAAERVPLSGAAPSCNFRGLPC